MQLLSLPDDVLFNIALYLSIIDVLSLRQVSKNQIVFASYAHRLRHQDVSDASHFWRQRLFVASSDFTLQFASQSPTRCASLLLLRRHPATRSHQSHPIRVELAEAYLPHPSFMLGIERDAGAIHAYAVSPRRDVAFDCAEVSSTAYDTAHDSHVCVVVCRCR